MDLDADQLEWLADSLVDSHESLMKKLIAMRKKHELSQEAVAERMGVSQPTVAAFERYDSNPTLGTIRRYALAVGASIEHSVEDQCARTDAAAFRSVISGKPANWYVSQSYDFEWAAGPMNVVGYVGRS